MYIRKVEVNICTGTTCYILGGSKYLMLADQLRDDVLNRVNITGKSCMGYCNSEGPQRKLPCITIDGITYHGLSLEQVVKIVTEAVAALPAA